jgi:3-dehydroquinate dehydratase-1
MRYNEYSMKLSIGNLSLGAQPLIAAALTDTDVLNLGREAACPADILELRVDMFSALSPEHLRMIFGTAREKFGKPLLATVRDIAEGGRKEIDNRPDIYRLVIPLSEAVDVELNAGGLLRDVRQLCSANHKPLIGSYHNFTATPDDMFLDAVTSRGRASGVDIVKIAAMPATRDDMTRLMLFTLKHREKGMITMSMGETGLPSRVFGFLFGSLITYGYVTKPSAPGQLSIAELSDILNRLRLR